MANPQLKEAFEKERATVSARCKQGDFPDSALSAIEAHFQRIDETYVAVKDYAKVELACKKGCNYCCHFKVEVGAEEVFLIIDTIKKKFDQPQIDRLSARAKQSQKTIQQMTQARRIQTNVACALLEDGLCTVYESRPAVCRKIHSQNVDSCLASYNNPEDPDIQNGEVALISSVLTTMSSAARQGIDDAELDASLYDLNEVLWSAMSEARYAKRWKNGKKAFT